MKARSATTSERNGIQQVRGALQRLWDWLTAPSPALNAAADRRQAQLLILLSLTIAFTTSIGVLSVLLSQSASGAGLVSQLTMALTFIVAYFISRTRHVFWSGVIVAASTAVLPILFFALSGNYSSSNANSTLLWALIALLLAGLFFSSRLFLLFFGAVLLSLAALPSFIPEVTFSQLFLVLSLNFVVGTLTLVNKTYRLRLEAARQAELASANRQLETARAFLERRVAERTRDLALAADLGRTISQVRDLDALLNDTVELVRARFDLYHVQIYLADEKADSLLLRAGTGVVSEQLISQSHRLPIATSSINGLAATNKRAVVVSDTTESVIFRPNELLPHTRSEMAVPLIAGDRVVGVLDLQSRVAHGLAEERLAAFEALAGQLAIAIENARLFAEAAGARAELEAQAAGNVRADWRSHLDAVNRREWLGFVHDNDVAGSPRTTPLSKLQPTPENNESLVAPISVRGQAVGSIWLERENGQSWNKAEAELVSAVARQVAEQVESLRLLAEAEQYRYEAEEANRRLVRQGWDDFLASADSQAWEYVYDQNEVTPLSGEEQHPAGVDDLAPGTISRPLSAGNETIGLLQVVDTGSETEKAAELIDAVAERLSAHIENLRLSQQTERALADTEEQARRLAVLNEMGAALTAAQDETDIFMTVARYGREILPGDEMGVGFLDADGDAVEMFALSDQEGLVSTGAFLSLQGTAIGKTIDSNQPVRLPAEALMDDFADTRDLAGKGINSAMFAPIGSGAQALGALFVRSKTPRRYDENSESLMSQVAALLAATAENRRLLQQIQRRAMARAALNEASLAIVSQPDQTSIYQVTVQSLVEKFGMTFAGIWTPNGTDRQLILQARAGEVTDQGDWPTIVPLDGPTRLARVASKQAPQVNNDLTDDDSVDGKAWVKESKLVAFAGYPLLAGNELIGVLGMFSHEAIPEQTAPLLQSLAMQVGTVINTQRLFEQTEHQLSDLEAIQEMTSSLTAVNTFNEAIDVLLPRIAGAVAADKASFLLMEGDDRVRRVGLYRTADGRATGELLSGEAHPLEENPLARQAIEAGKLVAVTAGDPALLQPATAAAMIPLTSRNEVFGLLSLSLHQEGRHFTDHDINLLQTLADQAMIAIHRVRLLEAARRKARHEQILREITARVSRSADVDTVMRTAVEEVGRALGRRAFVYFDSQKNTPSSKAKNGA